MRLADAEMQELTGSPVVEGSLSIGTREDMAALGMPSHDRLILSLTNLSSGLLVNPATSITRHETGFCSAEPGEYGLSFGPLTLEDIARQADSAPVQVHTRSGYWAGDLIRGNPLDSRSFVQSVGTYELTTHKRSGGIHFAITGRLGPVRSALVNRLAADLDGKPFSIDAIVPTATLLLKNLWHAPLRCNELSKTDSIDRPRDAWSLHDLLINPILNAPIIEGHIALTPEPGHPENQGGLNGDFVYVDLEHLDDGLIHFSDAPSLMLFENGLASGTICSRHLAIPIKRSFFQQFERQDGFSTWLSGDVPGFVSYARTGSNRAGPDNARQDIRTISLEINLRPEGLRIAAAGEFKDYDPLQNRQLEGRPVSPCRTYELVATVPWALIVAKGMRLARRARDFLPTSR